MPPPVVAALVLLAACAQSGERSRGEREVVEWAGARALPLASLDPGELDPQALAGLERELEGVRIVLLGEPDHFIHEKNDARLLLIGWLFQRGFHHVGMEMGHSDAWRMDRFLATGEEAWLERVALYGYDGDRRADRDDGVEGWTRGRDEELARRVDAESRRLLRRLRALNAGREQGTARLEWFGYDVSFAPGGDLPVVRDLERRLARVEGESRDAEVERLEGALALLTGRRDDLRQALGEDDARELARMVRNLADSLRWAEAAALPRGSARRRQGLVAREQSMMRALDERLESLGPDARLVLLGHDLHLARASTELTLGGEALWTTVGTHLATRDPQGVYAIWMLFDHGQHGNPDARPTIEPLASVPGSVEGVLAQVGERFLLPLGRREDLPRWLLRRRSFLRGARGVLPDQADAVLFLRTVSAPQER